MIYLPPLISSSTHLNKQNPLIYHHLRITHKLLFLNKSSERFTFVMLSILLNTILLLHLLLRLPLIYLSYLSTCKEILSVSTLHHPNEAYVSVPSSLPDCLPILMLHILPDDPHVPSISLRIFPWRVLHYYLYCASPVCWMSPQKAARTRPPKNATTRPFINFR